MVLKGIGTGPPLSGPHQAHIHLALVLPAGSEVEALKKENDVDTSKEENKVPKAADATVDASPASPQPDHAPVSQWKQRGPTSVTRLGFKPPLKESEAPEAKKANSPKGATASFEAAGASMSEWFQGKV